MPIKQAPCDTFVSMGTGDISFEILSADGPAAALKMTPLANPAEPGSEALDRTPDDSQPSVWLGFSSRVSLEVFIEAVSILRQILPEAEQPATTTEEPPCSS